MTARTILFAGGGTGGHLFPALAIEERARATGCPLRTIYICSDRPLDARILAGRDTRPIPAQPFSLRPRGLIRFLGSWGNSVRAARAAIRDAKREGEVRLAAMGGFVAPPCVQAARAEHIPVTLINLDAAPGKANRWIARHAGRILTTIPPIGRPRPWEVIGPIVRAEAIADAPPADCRIRFNLDPDRPTLLVTGASQGARSLNLLMVRFAEEHAGILREDRWQIIHQTGPQDFEALRAVYAANDIPAFVEPFIDAMGAAWGAADLAMSRAGAGSVAEAWANTVPTLFLPYPYHRDQHQRRNAQPLADAGTAVLGEDLIDPGRNLAAAGQLLLGLMADTEIRSQMRSAFASLGPADGAEKAAKVLLS